MAFLSPKVVSSVNVSLFHITMTLLMKQHICHQTAQHTWIIFRWNNKRVWYYKSSGHLIEMINGAFTTVIHTHNNYIINNFATHLFCTSTQSQITESLPEYEHHCLAYTTIISFQLEYLVQIINSRQDHQQSVTGSSAVVFCPIKL